MTTFRQRIDRYLDSRSLKGTALGPYEIEHVKDLRTRTEDGIDLLGDLYRPIGADESLPTVVIRGPYGRGGFIGGMARSLAYEGFTVFFQSSRGTSGSGGTFVPQIDEQRDGIETLRWVRRQPWYTGRLATSGESYMGYTQWAVAGKLFRDEPETAPEALILKITMPDFGAITWDHGALSLRNALGWTRMMVALRKGGPALLAMVLPSRKLTRAFDVLPLGDGDRAASGETVPWYQDWLLHEDLTDTYWTQQSHTASVPDVTAPVLMVTGWYDIFLPWQLSNYRQLVDAGNPPLLTVGPWGHITPEKAPVAHTDSVGFLKEVFAGVPSGRATAVRAFQTGAEQWHDLAEWPPAGVADQAWFLGSEGSLGADVAASGTTTYTFDPNDPTPALGGPSLEADTLPKDNATLESRPDVRVFRSETLSEAVELAGVPVATVRIRSSAPSFDVFVRITDVHPDGASITVCDGIRRIGSVGTGGTDPEPDEEGFRDVAVSLWPAFHRFAAGHRVSVQLSSGAHPRYARNPGTGEPALTAATTVVAHQEIAHGGDDGTSIRLPIWTR